MNQYWYWYLQGKSVQVSCHCSKFIFFWLYWSKQVHWKWLIKMLLPTDDISMCTLAIVSCLMPLCTYEYWMTVKWLAFNMDCCEWNAEIFYVSFFQVCCSLKSLLVFFTLHACRGHVLDQAFLPTSYFSSLLITYLENFEMAILIVNFVYGILNLPVATFGYSVAGNYIELIKDFILILFIVYLVVAWTSYLINIIAGCAYTGNAGNVFPATAG